MASGEGQRRHIEGVEVEIRHAFLNQTMAEIGSSAGGNQLARFRVIVQALEPLEQPIRHRSPAALAEIHHPAEMANRHDTRHQRCINARRRDLVPKTQEQIDIEEILGDRAVGTIIDLRLEIGDIRHL